MKNTYKLDYDNKKLTPYNHSNPITARKTSNRLYGGYNCSQKFYTLQAKINPIEIFNDFCSATKDHKSIEEVLNYLHTTAVSKLGYKFTAVGLLNSQSNCLNIKLTDHVGNVYSSKILLSETQNPIIESFISKEKKNINDINFINIPYLNNSPATIIPLISSEECMGIFIASSSADNHQNDAILTVLTDYLTLLIVNKQLSKKTNHDSNIDNLTGLKNFRDFQESLSLEINNAKAKSQSVSVIIMDIINISQINREYGHAKGDEVIRTVAEKISKNIRTIDTAGRYGSDEIAVILPDTDNVEACYMAEYINHSISCCLIDDIGSVKVSIGVATYPSSCANNQEKLLMLAEQAMFISKKKGYEKGLYEIISAQNVDFWNEISFDSLADILASRHTSWGLNFEDEIVKKFHSESLSSNSHMLDLVTSLAGAIDAKDTYTRGHSQSVSRYAEALARSMNLPESQVERIKLGAILHDVGKIGIPESVLSKPGKLSPEEWDIMKQHPNIGVEKVIKPLSQLKDLIPIIKSHHEQWDGKGYPDGLAGEDIPLEARIVSVVDAFHSMVSHRPYRQAMPVDKAMYILKSGAGTQWDKNLVRKFLIIAPSLCTKV